MKKAKNSRIEMSKHFDYSKHPIMVYIVEEHGYIIGKIGLADGFGIYSSINGYDNLISDFLSRK